jgi:hypothetical protein
MRPAAGGCIVAAVATEQTSTVTLTLRLGATPIEGTLQAADGAISPFRGWLELTSLVEAAAGGRQGRSETETQKTRRTL